MFAKPYRLIEGLCFSILLTSSGVVHAQAAELSECIYTKVSALSGDARLMRDALKALQCIDSEPVRFFDFAFNAQLSRKEPMCNRFDELAAACKSWLRSDQLEPGRFTEIARIVHQCVNPLSSLDLKLKRASISSGDALIASLRTGMQLTKQCKLGEEHAEVKPSLAWSSLCNDYAEAPKSFWEMNDQYYEPCKNQDNQRCSDSEASLRKGRLLRAFAASAPLGVPWQRIVASIMAIDSIVYGLSAEERASAAKVLGRHGDYSPSVMYALLQSLRDPDPSVRAEAALALRTQGNRSPLIVYSLISLLYDSDVTPTIKGNVALALREQAVSWECLDKDLDMTGLNDSWSKNEIGQAIPVCQKTHSETLAQSSTEGGAYFGLTKLGPMLDAACAIAASDPNATLFDAIDAPSQLADFDIARNLCYTDKQVSPSKLVNLARLVLMGLLSDEDDEVKIRALIALRNLGEPINGDSSIINRIRGEFLRHENYRVREAAIFALTKAAKSQIWLTSEFLRLLKADSSPSVRKTLVASLSTLTPLRAKAGNSVYQHYLNAIKIVQSITDICNPASPDFTAAFDLVLSLGPQEEVFFTNGLNATRDARIDLECPEGQLVNYPKLLDSWPKPGQDAVPIDSGLMLEWNGKLDADLVRQYLEVVQRDRLVPFTILELTTQGAGPTERTMVKLKFDTALSYDQIYKVTLKKGFHHLGKTPSNGLEWERSFLFQTESFGVGDQVFDLMSSDPSMDVRFSSAEVFAKDQPKIVFEFLYPLLDDKNPEIALRATSYLSSGLLNLDFVNQLTAQQQLEFATELFRKIMQYINDNSRDLATRKASQFIDLQYFPTLGQQLNLIKELLDQPWLSQAIKKQVVEDLKMQDWLLAMMQKDFPQQSYTPYERIYYGSIRTLIKDIINEHLLDKTKHKSVDFIIYDKMPLKSEEGP